MRSPRAYPIIARRNGAGPLYERAARWLRDLWWDARCAVAGLRRQAGFSLGAIVILGSAAGAVTSLFVVFESTVARPLPIGDPSSLFAIGAEAPPGERYGYVSFAECRYFDEQSQLLWGATSWGRNGALVTSPGARAAVVELHFAPANYFDVLRAGVATGRAFNARDDSKGAQPVAIISDRLWREVFRRDDAIVGRAINLYGQQVIVVGVAAPGFVGIDERGAVDLWLPLSTWDVMSPSGMARSENVRSPSACVARLREGVSLAAATSELRTLNAAFRRAAAIRSADVFLAHSVADDAGAWHQLPRVKQMAFVFTALAVVLLVACANVGNILLAKGLARTPEIGVRIALGATPSRVVRQFVTESFVLSLAAGAVALAMSSVLPAVAWNLFGLQPGKPGLTYLGSPVDFPLRPGGFVAAFVIALAVTAATGLAPAIHAVRVGSARHDGQRAIARKGGLRMRSRLLTLEVGVTTVLLVLAALLTRTAARSATVDVGFSMAGLTTIAIQLPTRGAALSQDTGVSSNLRAVLEHEGASVAWSDSPVFGVSPEASFRAPGPRGVADDRIALRSVSDHYFDVTGIPLVAGRPPRGDSGDEFVVSESAARLFWPERTAIGQTLIQRQDAAERFGVVVGVARDVMTDSLRERRPTIYGTNGDLIRTIITRDTSQDISSRVRSMVIELSPGASVVARPLETTIPAMMREAAAAGRIAWAIAGMALLLAAIGTFGVSACMVEERRQEIGIRMALGAAPREVVRTVLADLGRPLAWGLAGGLLLAIGCTRMLRQPLYGLGPFDPVTYAQVTVILAVAAFVATWVPARRIATIDPARSLRGN